MTPPTFTLGADVRIQTDSLGVPHAYAQSDADLMYASGWLQGTARLGEIQLNRRAALGTLAEVEGEGAVGGDLVARAFDFQGLACATLQQMQADRPDDTALTDAFAAGLNRAGADIAAGTVPAPPGWDADAAPFTTLDILTMGKRVSLGYSNQLDFDLLNTIAGALVNDYDQMPVYQPAVARFVEAEGTLGPPAPTPTRAHRVSGVDASRVGEALRTLGELHTPDRASNNWVVSGAYTANGRPLLANDPHSTLQAPARFMAYHLNSKDAGGNFDVAGFAFPGVPAVQLGHTDTLGWIATTAFADLIDLYDVPVTDDVATIAGEEVAVERETVELGVLGDAGVQTQSYTISRVPGYGPMLPDEVLPIDRSVLADGEILVRWVGFEVVDTAVFQYYDLSRGTDLDDFRGAIDFERYGMQNWVGATADGWAYKTHGDLPIRGGNPAAILDGTDPDQAWTGAWVDPSELPHVDGDRPYLVSANNDPLGVTADNDALNDAIYYGSWFDPGFRADRIASRLDDLTAQGNLDVQDMMDLQLDVYSGLSAALIPTLVEVGARIDTDEALADYRGRTDLADAITTLDAWDRHMDRDAKAAALARTWLSFLQSRVLSGDFSILFEEIENASPVTLGKLLLRAYEDDNDALLDGQRDSALLAALDDALAWTADHGDPTWGDIHVSRFRGVFGADVDVVTPGDDTCVNVAKGGWFSGGELTDTNVSWEGALFRQVTRFGDDGVPEMWFNLPQGESSSTDAWVEGTYDYLPFRADEVAAATVSEATLAP